MSSPELSEFRRLLHALREPLGALAIHIGLLEKERLSAHAQDEIKAMRSSMEHAVVVFEEIDFVLENGHSRPRDRSGPALRPDRHARGR